MILYDKHKKSKLADDFSLLNQQIILDDLYNNYLKNANTQAQKCKILNNQLYSQQKINEELFKRLRLVNKNAIVETDNNLKYMYVLTNIKLWLHNKKINKECGGNIKSILYFYPEISGYSAEKVKLDAKTRVFEHKLSRLAKKCDFRSFALPYINYIPILNQIIEDYNVSSAPVAVINNKVYYDIPNDLNTDFLNSINCN